MSTRKIVANGSDMIRKPDREGSLGFTYVNKSALLTNDGVDAVSARACKGGSDFVSLAIGPHYSSRSCSGVCLM